MQSDNTALRRHPRSAIRKMCWLLSVALSGCAVEDSRTAETAQHSLVGWSKLAAETCLGAPVHESSFGDTDILTYGASSTDSHTVSIGLPLVIGISVSGGGYCNAVIRVQGGRVAEVRYIGETNAYFGARDAYCAPIVRNCVEHPPLAAAAGEAGRQGDPR
jgi:hypothetical protein